MKKKMEEKKTLECISDCKTTESCRGKIKERIYQVLKSISEGIEKHFELYEKAQKAKYRGRTDLQFMDESLEKLRWHYQC